MYVIIVPYKTLHTQLCLAPDSLILQNLSSSKHMYVKHYIILGYNLYWEAKVVYVDDVKRKSYKI